MRQGFTIMIMELAEVVSARGRPFFLQSVCEDHPVIVGKGACLGGNLIQRFKIILCPFNLIQQLIAQRMGFPGQAL